MPHGLLLINLGTPDEPTTPAVRRYLREFLSDPRVLDINAVGRALLLHLVILPRRPAKSAEAYRSIWDGKRGSSGQVSGGRNRSRTVFISSHVGLRREGSRRIAAGW